MASTGYVLHVEDNSANLLLMQRIFDRMDGIDLQSATDAETGFKMVADIQPDLNIRDISLPRMDDFEALDVLKSTSETRHLQVIAISANALPAQVTRGGRSGLCGLSDQTH